MYSFSLPFLSDQWILPEGHVSPRIHVMIPFQQVHHTLFSKFCFHYYFSCLVLCIPRMNSDTFDELSTFILLFILTSSYNLPENLHFMQSDRISFGLFKYLHHSSLVEAVQWSSISVGRQVSVVPLHISNQLLIWTIFPRTFRRVK